MASEAAVRGRGSRPAGGSCPPEAVALSELPLLLWPKVQATAPVDPSATVGSKCTMAGHSCDDAAAAGSAPAPAGTDMASAVPTPMPRAAGGWGARHVPWSRGPARAVEKRRCETICVTMTSTDVAVSYLQRTLNEWGSGPVGVTVVTREGGVHVHVHVRRGRLHKATKATPWPKRRQWKRQEAPRGKQGGTRTGRASPAQHQFIMRHAPQGPGPQTRPPGGWVDMPGCARWLRPLPAPPHAHLRSIRAVWGLRQKEASALAGRRTLVSSAMPSTAQATAMMAATASPGLPGWSGTTIAQ